MLLILAFTLLQQIFWNELLLSLFELLLFFLISPNLPFLFWNKDNLQISLLIRLSPILTNVRVVERANESYSGEWTEQELSTTVFRTSWLNSQLRDVFTHTSNCWQVVAYFSIFILVVISNRKLFYNSSLATSTFTTARFTYGFLE